eukprot:TRINITY_DN3349_c0_g2_i3.p1 TRINITY_DN3349_c0_g2~~TRINITY_DN3349_c0_g2_i3.p1  ORF type:complete len:284 (+),score=26.96 TRINITY_DN3349_c0_g2_i3:264-1115(+)
MGDRAFNFAIMRVLRLVRLIRLARVVRILRLFAELRSTVIAIVLCFRPLAGALVILVVVIYIFAILFTEIALNERVALHMEDSRRALLKSQFGSMQASMETLLVAITGGVDWFELATSLTRFGRVVFHIFVVFSTLGMFNVITSVFVESTKKRVEQDRLSCLYACADKIFKSCDDENEDGIPTLSLKKLQNILRTNTEVAQLISTLRLSKSDVENVFNLLISEKDSVDVDSFINTLRVIGEPARRLEQTMVVSMLVESQNQTQTGRPTFLTSMGSAASLQGVC